MAWLPIASSILSGVGGIIGSNQQNHSNQQMQQLIQQIMGNATNVNNQTLGGINSLQKQAGQYGAVMPGLSGSMVNESTGAGAQAPGAASQYMNNAMSPEALAAATGINAGGLTQGATNYFSNPNGTNLAGVTPSALSFYGNEAKTGLNPQVSSNAQDQLQQQFHQSMAGIRSQAAPGQNINATQQAAQNSLLTNSTNLGGNLAGLDQQYRNIGEQGVLSTAQGLDTQKAGMLGEAAQLGTNYNQTVLGDQAAGAGFGQQLLAALQNFAGQGNQMNEFGISALGSLGGQLNQQGEFFAGLGAGMPPPTNPFSAIGTALSGMGSTGGSKPGGLGLGSGGISGTSFDLPPINFGQQTLPQNGAINFGTPPPPNPFSGYVR